MHSSKPLLIVIILALVLRLPLLNSSFWLDEAAQALESTRTFSQQWQISADFQPPLFHYLIHFVAQVSQTEWWLRAWGALLPAVLSVYLLAILSRKLIPSPADTTTNPNYQIVSRLISLTWLLPPLLLATSSLHIFYSQELRPYSLAVLWACSSWLALLNRNLGLWTGFNILGFFTSYLFPFNWLSQLLWLSRSKTIPTSKVIFSISATLIAFSFWLPMLQQQLLTSVALRVALPNWSSVVSTPQLKALPLLIGKFIYGVLLLDVSPFMLGASGALAILITFLFWKQRRAWRNWSHNINTNGAVIFWLIIPVLSSWAFSFIVPVIAVKRLLFVLPAFYLTIGFLVHHSLEHPKRWVQRTTIGLGLSLLALNAYSVTQYWQMPHLQRENWRALTAQITQAYPADKTLILFPFDGPFAPWEWYMKGAYQTWSFPHFAAPNPQELQDLLSTALPPNHRYQYLVQFTYLQDLSDPSRTLNQALSQQQFEIRGLIDGGQVGFINIWSPTQTQ